VSEIKKGRPVSSEKFIKTQISFPEKMYNDLDEINRKKSINNFNAVVRTACYEYLEREKKS